MAITISESTFRKTLKYLTALATNGDRTAAELLSLLPAHSPPANLESIPDFDKRLFAAWKELVELQVGKNCWSYSVSFDDLQHLELTQIDSLQLLAGRGTNYVVKSQQVGDLAFHSEPNFSNIKTGKVLEVVFKVGDRIRVNANRQQYINQMGVVDQVISVSCRVKLDNGWIAFLPNHCLEKIT
jgi:hypothetical protein